MKTESLNKLFVELDIMFNNANSMDGEEWIFEYMFELFHDAAGLNN